MVNKIYFIEKTAICRLLNFKSGERAFACCTEEILAMRGGICSVTKSCQIYVLLDRH